MGGLISLLQLRRHGVRRIQGLINVEGNLASEDCMFSRRVVAHSLDEFSRSVFAQIIEELRSSRYTGDQTISHNLAMNVDARAYYAYSFQTVRESDSGCLLDEFLQQSVPRLFLYGEANRGLSYLQRLHDAHVQVTEISRSAHFLFYDNPVDTYEAIGTFVHTVAATA